MPCAIACAGDAIRTGLPRTRTSPESAGVRPKIVSAARRLAERLTSVGYPPEAHFFAGEGHIFSTTARNREWELLVDFFARALSPKDKAPEVKDGLVRSPE